MKIPSLKIDNLIAKVPVVQGGMGVGISLSSLAGAVAKNGGIGVLSGVEIGFDEPDYFSNKKEANIRALKKHIRKAKALSNGGIIGINLMTVLNDFEELVKESIKEKIDIIFSGAGLPINLPKFTKGSNTKIAPIVSSSKAAKIICKKWDKKYNVIPDAIVVEGPDAGGHLGFKKENLQDQDFSLINIIKDVLETIKPFEEKYNKPIPIIAGGGIDNGKDIGDILMAGASGVQIGTRFIATDECDASDKFKENLLQCKSEDIVIINSPVGMIGRAISNDFLDAVSSNTKRPIGCISNCLKPCIPTQAPYCIAEALINAQKGYMENGFAFAGAKAYKVDKIIPVKTLMDNLMTETKSYLDNKY
ncbi:nitronate monooxygenase [Clostridium sp. D2Q-11]|uniref:Probable nitronate monooxygenase n=1 Tax=Anaeromonas frigoriresistens TaxID=2683708 RepID=A0A942UW31_9FIRM|nr:nitronate monooxygenase family protein [Anaeromonas frigoriresistens]MBS4539130.1 nitronate monooxygenase [Anaeromonas frigoriresistens]